MNWYVIYTKSRYEKAVALKLETLGIEVYCPILKKKKKWSDRWKWIEEPLFRSYCFVKIEEVNRDKVFAVPGVVRYLYHCGKPAIVRNTEIELLQKWLNEYAHERINSFEFRAEDKVFLRSGLFMDQQARVLTNDGNFLTLILESFGFKIKVDLRTNIIEKVIS